MLALTLFINRLALPGNTHPDFLLKRVLNLSHLFFWVTAFTDWSKLHYNKVLNLVVIVLCLATNSKMLWNCFSWLATVPCSYSSLSELAVYLRENSNIKIPCWWRMSLLWKWCNYSTCWGGGWLLLCSQSAPGWLIKPQTKCSIDKPILHDTLWESQKWIAVG